jgi:hypothetical protein
MAFRMVKRSDLEETPAVKPWKKFPGNMTPEEIVLDGSRTLALSIIPQEFPLFHDSEENYDRLDAAVERHYKGIWTPETVRFAIRYERERLLWDKPAPPPQPAPPPKPQYDEGPLKPLADGSWPLLLDASEWEMRSASKEQMKDLLERLRKYEAWKNQNEQ